MSDSNESILFYLFRHLKIKLYVPLIFQDHEEIFHRVLYIRSVAGPVSATNAMCKTSMLKKSITCRSRSNFPFTSCIHRMLKRLKLLKLTRPDGNIKVGVGGPNSSPVKEMRVTCRGERGPSSNQTQSETFNTFTSDPR